MAYSTPFFILTRLRIYGMYVRIVVMDFRIYINSRFQLTVSFMCVHFTLQTS